MLNEKSLPQGDCGTQQKKGKRREKKIDFAVGVRLPRIK